MKFIALTNKYGGWIIELSNFKDRNDQECQYHQALLLKTLAQAADVNCMDTSASTLRSQFI